MRFLLDAHALLWFRVDDSRLSHRARTIMMEPANELLLSLGTCWEIAIKVRLGKLTLPEPFGNYIESTLASSRVGLLPINTRHLEALTTLPLHHRDPFDRLIVAQALEDELQVVSIDSTLDPYGIKRVW